MLIWIEKTHVMFQALIQKSNIEIATSLIWDLQKLKFPLTDKRSLS